MQSKGVLDDRYAIERLHKPELIFRYKVRSRFVKKNVSTFLQKDRNLNIIDFGAAEGLTLLEMNRLFPESNFLGIEYSEALIKKAPELTQNIKLIQGDVTRLSPEIKEDNYDVVCALALLEHLKNPLDAVLEAKRVLRKGGLFIASSPNPFWDHVSTRLKLLRDEQHEVDINRKVMLELLHNAGMELVVFRKFMWSPVSILPYLNIKVNPDFSLKIDAFIAKLKIFNWLFVNQAIIARKI
jgi:2-polyprenyl-3-methyl-5-hydroxy-6-metoxy-1,4-benzoquinol methylase